MLILNCLIDFYLIVPWRCWDILSKCGYLYRLERRLSEESFWLVTDDDFINLLKLLGEKSVVDLYYLPVVEVLGLSWEDIITFKLCAVDPETHESLDSMNKTCEPIKNKKANQT